MEAEAEKVLKAFNANKDNLSGKEIDVITRYYGLSNQVRHTLAELGTIHGVTRERIRQVKSVALKKLGI